MKMDALNFLKKNDKKKQKKNVKKNNKISSLQQLIVDPRNPWTIFKMVDKSLFKWAIEDFVKQAKWQDILRKPASLHKNIEFKIDLDTIDLEQFGRVLNGFVPKNPEPNEKDIDWEIKETTNQVFVEHVTMFYSLRMFIPWYAAIHFLREYADDKRGLLAPDLYKYYLATPNMVKLKTETRQYLQRRIAHPVGITNKELNNPVFKNIFKTFYNDKTSEKYICPPPRVKTEKTRIDNKVTCVGGDYDPMVLEKIYPRYEIPDMINMSWLNEYDVKGFVVACKNDIFATPIEVRYKNTIWYKVNKLFYKQLDSRKFVPDRIGYIMKDSSIVIETYKMFEKLKYIFELRQNKSKIISGYEVALNMIQQNILLNSIYTVKEVNSFATKILESFKPCETTKDIAQKLSFVLVYFLKLIQLESNSQPVVQSYIEDTRKKMYAPEKLLYLKKDVLLPEVYSLPDNYLYKKTIIESVEKIITQSRKDIETEFYIQLEEKKLPEAGRVQVRPKLPIREMHRNRLMKGDKFAPGLIQKLKTLINDVSLNNCSLCGNCVYNTSYKSICSGEVRAFCNQECFDNFEFKNEKNV